MYGDAITEQPSSLDGFAFAVILHAMKQGKPLQIHGPVTRQALCNLEELQQAWSLWRPNHYHHIDIDADEVIDRLPAVGNKAICAFSGGLDSTFTALRHRLKLAGSGSYDVRSMLMVQGFDIGFDNDDYFERAVERARPFVERLNVDMRFITTNSENPLFQDWEDSHGAELACCLHQFADEFQYGLIGSTKPYDGLVLPYGSNPATDHLLSGGGFAIVHDGSGFSRTAKAEVVSRYDFAVEQLRVCYAGKLQYKNCGRCEKCLRTYLNFLAAGNDKPACFDRFPDLEQIANIKTYSQAQLAELTSIVEHAARKGIRAPWLQAVQRSIDSFTPRSRAGHTLTKTMIGARRCVSRGLDHVGLKQPIKAALHWLYERTAA
ncbi:MAG: hypothetical protein QM808_00630 [Steroidobacteraceae bacterium]